MAVNLAPLQRLLQLGFLKPDSLKNASAIKSAQTKYNKALKSDKAFARNEKIAAENEYQTVKQKFELDAPRKMLDIGEWENKPIMGILSDRSMKGEINQVAGIPLESPTYAEGGMMFPRAHQGEGAGWMSMYTTAKPVQKKIMDIAEATGESPIVMPMAMGREATNFSTPVADIMLKQVRANPPKKAAIKEFDAEMRKSYKDWVGLDDPRAYDQLMGLGDFPMEGAGKMRTAFSTIMGKAAYRDKGFPSYEQALNAVNDPAFRGMPIGTTGFTSFVGDPATEAYRRLGLHGSYDTVIPTTGYTGAFEAPVTMQQIFQESMANLGKEMTKGKNVRPFTEGEKINAVATRGAASPSSYEVMTPQKIDALGAAIEKNKANIAKYGSVPAMMAAGETFAASPESVSMEGLERDPSLLNSLVTGAKRGFYKANSPEGFVLGLMGALGAPSAAETREKLAQSKYKDDEEKNQLLRLLGEIVGGSASVTPF